jgi:C1A family cysteine protease
MKTVICLLVVLVALVAGTREQFEEFKRKHEKSYSSVTENEYRFRVFEQSLERVARRNAKTSLARFGVTKFSDLTPGEFANLYLMKNFDKTYMPEAPVWDEVVRGTIMNSAPRLPSEYDWKSKGKVTPVNDQGQCGSCWDFSATETIESVYAIAGHSLTPLSEQQILDCDTSGQDQGCNGGFPYGAYQYVITAGGIETSADYPYTAESSSCQFNNGHISAKIQKWEYVTQSKSEPAMQSFLYAHSPLSVCVDAEIWQDYNGGVISTDDNCGTSIDHCVQATGWSNQNNTKVWNVRNSWGASWGESGYIYLEMGHDVCGVAEIVTVPCVTSCPGDD